MSGAAARSTDTPQSTDLWAGMDVIDQPPNRKASRKPPNRAAAANAAPDEPQFNFDFAEPLPDLNERAIREKIGYTTTPNELIAFQKAYRDNGAAQLLVSWFVSKTYGGQYDESTWGDVAVDLRKRGLRPRWLPLTMADIGVVLSMGPMGAQKVMARLVADGIFIKMTSRGKTWYALDYQRMAKLDPAPRRHCVRRPKAEDSNIPSDAPYEATSPVEESSPEPANYAIESSHAVKCVSQVNDDLPKIQRETPVTTTGAPCATPIGIEVSSIRVRDIHGLIIGEAASRGRITSMTVVSESLGNVLDFTTDATAELVEGPGDRLGIIAITGRLNDLLADKLASKIPAKIASGVHKFINTEAALKALETRITLRWDRVTSWGLLYYEREGNPRGLAVEVIDLVREQEAQKAAAEAAAECEWRKRQSELQSEFAMTRERVMKMWENAAKHNRVDPERFRRELESDYPDFFKS